MSWRDKARCANTDINFFTSDPLEKLNARAMCNTQCPVKVECLAYALSIRATVGIWGGEEESELRRALSVDSHARPIKRARPPRCPLCKHRDLLQGETTRKFTKVECKKCGFAWALPGNATERLKA